MKKVGFVNVWSYLMLSVCLLFSHHAYAGQGLTKIGDNVYSYVDVKGASPQNSFGANAGIIIGRNGIIVVDTLTSAKEARRFIQDIRKISDKPIRYVVNTHYHLDHAFGNSEFDKMGAAIISHTNDKKNLEKAGETTLRNAKEFGLTEQDMEGTRIVYPAITFTERMEIDMGDQKVELIYFGPSHTSGSVVVYLPDRKILFSGDILFTGYHPFLAEGDLDNWGRALDQILHMDVATIIPGHGPVSDKKNVQEMKDYLITFDGKAKELSATSKDAAYIASEIKKALPRRLEGDFLIKGNIQMRYIKN